MLQVVCGIIYRDEKIFIARRKEGKPMSGKWEFPGGKIENEEVPEEALKRELMEELGMEVIVNRKVDSITHHYSNLSINLIAYHCNFISASYEMIDHDMYTWIDIKDVLSYDLSDADISLISKL